MPNISYIITSMSLSGRRRRRVDLRGAGGASESERRRTGLQIGPTAGAAGGALGTAAGAMASAAGLNPRPAVAVRRGPGELTSPSAGFLTGSGAACP